MRISVIIPIYNEEKVIGECLVSLAKQNYKDIEIIVVDDGSTDSTISEIKSKKTKLHTKNLKILKQEHKGPGAARNLGAKHAKGDILAFADADMTFEPDFIERLIAPILQGKAKGTFSKEEYVANRENIWSECWGINEGWGEGKRHPKNYPDSQKVFRAILKSEFERAGGFLEDVGYTDDWTLSEKLGHEAVAAPGAKFYHQNPGTLAEVFIQARWVGKRRYKFGKIGVIIAIIRASLPVSLVVGTTRALFSLKPQFLAFKIVYDFGVFLGTLDMFLTGKIIR